ncbi:MAG: kumamolisin, partial [Frankiales bacterium]|nr:kumamolisin [Frankiales bacterium]
MGATNRPHDSRAARVRRVLVLPLTAVCALAVAVPALVPGAAQAGDSATVSATVVLRTAGSAESLAETGDLPRSARMARLSATLPTVATQSGVQAAVRSLGLTVDDATPWSLVVHGAGSSIHQLNAVAGVSSVLVSGGPAPSSATAPGPLRGAQLRTAYQASGAQPPATAPKPIIATIQFSGWDASELAGYVTNANALHTAPALPAPVATSYTAVSVGGVSTTARSEPGSSEVALDQESIYDTYPAAQQRAYFAAAGTAGMVAALNKVAADALILPGLVALSISWTWCSSFLSGPDLQSMHAALANVVAAGVSVFAASGDDGAFCKDTASKDVSYPAADPLVIAVGGTTLTLLPTVEKGWGAPNADRISGFYGSGGGSSQFPVPPDFWQSVASNGSAVRDVPDISADADMDTGFISWHQRDSSGVGWQQSGGTSLASPVSAALYVAELGSRGATNGGLGDLHSALYTAPAADFRDVTSGTNGFYTAKPGYDMVTGLGAPLWGKVVDRLLTQPVISVPPALDTRVVPVTVTAPAGQTFIAWTTGYGNPPPACATSAAGTADPQPVTVPVDGSYRIWAVGYVGNRHCFIVSTTTVVRTGVTPTPTLTPTTTTAPPTTVPVVTTTPPAIPVTTTPPPATTPPATTPPGAAITATTTTAVVATAPPARDLTPPSATVSARQTSLGTAAVSYTWQTTDGSGSGIGSVAATVFRDGKPIWTRQVKAAASLT